MLIARHLQVSIRQFLCAYDAYDRCHHKTLGFSTFLVNITGMYTMISVLVTCLVNVLLSLLSDLLCARGLVSLHPDTGPDPDHWQKTGSSPRRANVWSAVVGPWRYAGPPCALLTHILVNVQRNYLIVKSTVSIWIYSNIRELASQVNMAGCHHH